MPVHLFQSRQGIPFRTLIPLFIALASTLPVQAQVKPELDPNIPPYQRVSDLSGSLSIAGSETMKPLTESWSASLQQRYPGLKIKVESFGSETGMAALLEGKAQIAALSRRMTQQEVVEFKREFGYEPTEVPVAVDALAVFVHKDNPIEGLSLPQLDAMFSKERRRGWPYPVNTWGDVLVLEEGWTDASINLYGRNSNSGTAAFFKEHVLNGAALKSTMTIVAGSASVVQEVTIDRFGVGLSGIGYQTSGIKPVPLASVEGGRYVQPSFQTAMDGSYPLRRNLYLYLNKPPKIGAPSPLAEYVKFALSRQGQQIVLSQGYYPLQTTELNRLAMMWKTPLRTSAAGEPGRALN
jgi:phosphate transport system substrate-binding protein